MIRWTGIAYRATTYDRPLWVRANRRAGRFNLAGVGSTQYLCLDSEAPFAEMLRAENLRTEHEVTTFSTVLWQLRVDEGAVADYGDFARAEAAGFPAAALVDDDHERCQREAQRLESLGAGGVLTPSAALPGSSNLTIFGPRTPIGWDATVRLASAIPVQRLSRGSAPPGLERRVRFYGDEHPVLLEYIRRRADRRK